MQGSLLWLLLLAISPIAFLAGIAVRGGYTGRLASESDVPTMTQCVTQTPPVLGLSDHLTTNTLQEIVSYCYSMIRSQDLLKDFVTRDNIFRQQYAANDVLLWLVVVITISGVALAAVQFVAAYQLAVTTRKLSSETNEIIINRSQVVLRSSVTGLFILVISFGFFLVFTLYIYRIDRPTSSGFPVSQQQNLPAGGLGPPRQP